MNWLRRHPWVAAWLAVLPVGVLRAGTIAENDTLWQIRTGLLQLESGHLLTTDPFTWTAQGQPWIQNSWAYNMLDALAYRVGGLAGVSLLGLMVFMGMVWLMLTLARDLGARPAPTALAVVFLAPLFLPLVNARPHVVDQVAFLAGALLARRLPRAARPSLHLAVLGAVCVLWANLHPATPILAATLGLAATAHGVLRDRVAATRLVAAVLVVVAATWINPYHYDVITQATHISQIASGNIIEWSRPTPSNPSDMLLLFLAAIAILAAVQAREVYLTGALALTTALYAVSGIRFGPFALVLAVPVLAAAVADRLEWTYRRYRPVLLGGLAAFSLVAAPSLGHLGRLYPAHFPVDLVDALPRGCRLINPIDFSGLVILRRPDIPISTDGRVELHPLSTLAAPEYWNADTEPLRTWLTTATCAITYQETPADAWLATSDQWRELGRDANAVTYVRTLE